MANVTATIRILDDAAVPAPVQDVLVRVFDAADAFLAEGLTDALGEIDFTLFGDTPGVDYIVRLWKDGVSFPTNPTKSINVTDPAVPSNEFEFTAHIGVTAQLAQFVVKDDQLTPQPMEDVDIHVFSSADVYLTAVKSDVDGEAELMLEGDPAPGREYIVRLRKDGYEFPLGPTQVIAVHDPVVAPATNVFDFEGHALDTPESSDAQMCLLYGYLVNTALEPLRNTVVEFQPRLGFPETVFGMYYTGSPSLVRDRMIMTGVTVETDDDGYVEVSLPRGGLFDVHIHGAEHPVEITFPIIIPDAAGYQLEDVVFPYVQEVVYDTDPIQLAVDETKEVAITATASSGVELSSTEDLNNFLEFTVDDPTVASVLLIEDKKIQVTGLAAGATNISVARKSGTVAPRLPEVADIIVTPPAVEVT
jgi:hypothetical protein